ncbi:MAG: SpoIID/LytB domain-containing protein [Leptolyngbya sp. SIO3F4]|nr:SpoIID/LytB domain-containing protein [Leptolyngbya sp. SIO3F4]
MPLSSLKVASLTLSGLIATTSLLGIAAIQTVKAEATVTSVKEKINSEQQNEKSTPTDSTKASISNTDNRQKAQKSSTIPVRIEPFIQADAVALGQWLVIKSVKSLVNKTSANASKPTPTEANTAEDPANRNTQPAQTQPKQPKPAPEQPPAPKVAVNALPPAPSDNPTIDGYTEMRVALTKQADTVTVAASQGGTLVSANGEPIESLLANVAYQVTANENGLFINGKPAPTAMWIEPDSGYVAVGDRWYRGRLLLLWQNGGVMAVNYVMLQDYLYSVVGAEMSASWSIEALKAQAVAARSYAIVHTVRHQRRAYDLDDTQRYQAYKGIRTEASSTHQAVHETSGEFISYGGGVVESLYAANQDIVNDAHSGYGMSQTGALDLAEQGYLYYEILSAYYPDTSVGRIDVSN